MMKKIVGMLLTLWILAGCCLSAGGEETGSIHIWLDPGDLAVTRGAVALYRVGDAIPEGYQINPSYGGGVVRQEDALSPYLAQWLAQIESGEGVPRILDADGQAEYSRLPDGLYLLIQTQSMEGFYSIRPTMITIPDEGVREVIVRPTMRPIEMVELPDTGDHFPSLAIAMALVLSGLGLAFCAERLDKRK